MRRQTRGAGWVPGGSAGDPFTLVRIGPRLPGRRIGLVVLGAAGTGASSGEHVTGFGTAPRLLDDSAPQHDAPHQPAGRALDAGEQFSAPCPAAAAVMARRPRKSRSLRVPTAGASYLYNMLGTQPVVLSASQVRAAARAMTAIAAASAAQSSRPSRSR